jgi:hypothetical protein
MPSFPGTSSPSCSWTSGESILIRFSSASSLLFACFFDFPKPERRPRTGIIPWIRLRKVI